MNGNNESETMLYSSTGVQPIEPEKNETKDTTKLTHAPLFCPRGGSPYGLMEWKKFHPILKDAEGNTIFEQEDVEAPAFWSERAVRITAQKYFRGQVGTPERETSVRQLVHRVVNTICVWLQEQEYFATVEDLRAFGNDLAYLILTQHGTFNSPVWFNLGVAGTPQQASACFPYETRINTDHGLIPIGEVCQALAEGRSISTYDMTGKRTPIVAAKQTGIRRTSRIFLADGSSIAPTTDHRMFVRAVDGTVRECLAGDLTTDDALALSRTTLLPANPPRYQTGLIEITSDLAWISGVMVGDGYSDRAPTATSDTWEIKVSSSQKQLLRIETILEKYEVPYTTKEMSWGWVVRGYGACGRAFWERLDLWGHTHNKRVPEWVFRTAVTHITAFLQGLFDADGCAPTRGHLTLYNTSKGVIDDCRLLLRSLGIFSATTEYADTREDYTRQLGYTLLIADTQSMKRYQELIGFTHEDKQSRLNDGRTDYTGREYRKDSVDVVGKQRGGGTVPVYDIQTESGTFWAEGILVHNCFIQSVEDDMESIADLQHSETMVFKRGSGSGTNFSALRSRKEKLSESDGAPSGPVSFMSGLDAWGGVVKSGGKTRRSAKMCLLDIDHPDIFEFIACKLVEEEKARALIAAGYSAHFDVENGAYASIKFQNANHSVRIPDAFMVKLEQALKTGEDQQWDLIARTTGEVIESVSVTKLWDAICQAAWQCGDPGIQYDTIHNNWHTCPVSGRIHGTNPCSEYTFLDDTSCNLASHNLLKYRNEDGSFDWSKFRNATRIFIIAQDALVERAYYPTKKLTEVTKKYHTLGLGYANLGALLMASGLPYNSEDGRKLAAHITSELTATAYCVSAELARAVGPFEAFERNRGPMLEVIQKHGTAAQFAGLPADTWEQALKAGRVHGYRNAQVTVLAPTGTIAFMMDCETTGAEPDLGLVKTKHLVGGGVEIMENRIVDTALRTLGYRDAHRTDIMLHLEKHGDLENSSLKSAHRAVFDCSLPNKHGTGVLSLDAHLKMIAALQPFISGSISKTVNIRHDATVKDMGDAYYQAWKLGIKSVAIYRDGCKQSQPVQTDSKKTAKKEDVPAPVAGPVRRKLLDHQSNMHRIKIKFGNVKGYVLVTPYEDTGLPGELFVRLAKEGSTISGLIEGWAQAISFCLQYGVPFETLVGKFSNTKFEPSGWSSDRDIRQATSIYDAVMRKLGAVFLPQDKPENAPGALASLPPTAQLDAPTCPSCGTLMVQAGATCHTCPSCGNTTGCG